MTRPVRHSLVLVARPGRHVHPWLPTCACSWQGIPGRLRFAVVQYRGHTNGRGARAARGGGPGPRPLTPLADLPDELR